MLSWQKGEKEMSNSLIIEYSDYYVAFLDILGFKALVNSSEESDRQKIFEYFHLVNKVVDGLKSNPSTKGIGSIIISDSVILSIPIKNQPADDVRKLRELCIAIQKIQFELAEMNIWLRGAISSGKVYFSSKDSQVVGPAYVNAYLLEERNAINPQVVIDNKLIKELNFNSAQDLIKQINNDESCSQEYELFERNILFQWTYNGIQKQHLEKDVALFIDYLVYGFKEESKLEKIITNLEESMYLNNLIYPKFRWVADYLLSSCQYYNDHSRCEIKSEVLIKQYKRLQKL